MADARNKLTAFAGHALPGLKSKSAADANALMGSEARFQLTAQQDPDRYRDLVARAQQQIQRRLALYQELAGRPGGHA